MKKMSLYVTDPQYDRIHADASRVGISFAEMVRRLLDETLAARAGSETLLREMPLQSEPGVEQGCVPPPG
jgi:hypothetical protein